MSACPNPAAQIVWRELYQRARQAQRPRVLSPFAGNGECGENGERPFRNGMWERGCSGMVGFPRHRAGPL